MTTITQLVAKVGIDTTDIPQQLQGIQRTLVEGVGAAAQQAQQPLTQLEGTFQGLTQEEARAEQQALRTAQAYARMLSAQGERAAGADVLRGALEQATVVDTRLGYSVQTQIANLERGKTAAQQYGEAFQQGLIGIVGPAAAASAAIEGVRQVEQSFERAFEFKAQLDQQKASIDVLLRGVRDSNEVWAEAARFQEQYKATQAETTEAIQASVRIIRSSKEPIDDILGTFARLKVLAPEKTFQDASRAISELQAGQVTSIEHLFNVPRRDANEMKKEIEGGADAIEVVSRYLDHAGVSMEALKVQTEGAAGAMKDVAKANEDLALAQGKWAEGPGLVILEAKVRSLESVTKALNGDTLALFDNMQKLSAVDPFKADLIEGIVGQIGPLGAYIQQMIELRKQEEAHRRQQQELIEGAKADDAMMMQLAGSTRGVSDITRKLSDEDLTKLQDKLTSTAESGAAAYDRMQQAAADYAEQDAARAAQHAQKIQDLQRDAGQRLADLARETGERRAELARDESARVADIERAAQQKALDDERQYHDQRIQLREQHEQKLAQIAERAAEQAHAFQEQQQRQAEDFQREQAQRAEAFARDAADRERGYAEQIAGIRAQAAQQSSDAAQRYADQRAAAEQRYQDSLQAMEQRAADLQAQADADRLDRARAYREQIANLERDAAGRAQDEAEDFQRQQQRKSEDHGERLKELQYEYGKATTDEQRERIRHQIDEENERYTIEARRAQEDYNRKREREREELQQRLADAAARRRQDEQAAQEKLARDQAALEQQRAQQAAAYQQQQQQAAAAYAADQATRDRALADQIAKAKAAYDKDTAQRQEKYARDEADRLAAYGRETAQRQQQYVEQQQALARQTAAENTEYQKRKDAAAKHYAETTAEARRKHDEQIADAERAYEKQLADLARSYARQKAEQARALGERIAAENKSYAEQEAQSQRAYEKQYQQLQEGVGKQLYAYADLQRQMSQISETEAQKRFALIAAEYGFSPDEVQRHWQEFVARMRGGAPPPDSEHPLPPGRALGGPVSAGALYQVNEQRMEYFRPSMSGTIIPLAPGGGTGGGVHISGPITVVLQGSGSTRQDALMLRDELVRIARQNAGNLWGGQVTS